MPSEPRRVLVTGCRGFLGRAVCQDLVSAGLVVVGMDLHEADEPEWSILAADLLDGDRVREALEGQTPFDVVIHTAALAHGQTLDAGQSYTQLNVAMTRNLLAAVCDAGPQFLLFSSVEVYGSRRSRRPRDASWALAPETDYGRSKAESEQLVLASELADIDILRLAPAFDSDHMKDVAKRVLLPGGKGLKMWLLPGPEYSLCPRDVLVERVRQVVLEGRAGRRAHIVCRERPYAQAELRQMFPGRSLPILVPLSWPLYGLMVLAGPLARGPRGLYRKLMFSNRYQTGTVPLPPFPGGSNHS